MVGMSSQDKLLWKEYISSRSHVADTSSKEAAATIFKNRDAIQRDIGKRLSITPKWKSKLPKDIDLSLRTLVLTLVQNEGNIINGSIGNGAEALASFLDERMCVPRDMGAMSAAAIKRIASNFD